MADKQVVISVGGAVVPIDRVANELGVSPRRLTEAARAAGNSDTKGVSDFYREWLEGRLPIGVRPCESRSLHKLYDWWCREEGLRTQSEVILMRWLPSSLLKARRWVRIGDDKDLRTMIEPADWRPDPDRPLAHELGDEREVFEKELNAL